MDDLPDECRQIAEEIGLDNMLALIRRFAGERVYFPTMERVAIHARNRQIRAEFNGRNYRDLAHRYGLTVTWIREIVAEDYACKKKSNIDKQLQLF